MFRCSEPKVAPIDTSSEVAPENAAREEPRWRRDYYDNAEGDAEDSVGGGAGYD